MFHSSYNCSSGESFGEVTVEELIYFCIALSRIEKFYYDYIYFPRSSLNIHQKIVSDYLDKNWVLHTNNKSDSEMKIKNQAYLGLISYLMNLDTINIKFLKRRRIFRKSVIRGYNLRIKLVWINDST
ncbi:MAG: hypothetical protein ACTSP3_17950 [Candidatus Heimdallarchaeaceae archaeon]